MLISELTAVTAFVVGAIIGSFLNVVIHRLPRGRSYLRNGSGFDLEITEGYVFAFVVCTSLYEVEVKIDPMAPQRWTAARISLMPAALLAAMASRINACSAGEPTCMARISGRVSLPSVRSSPTFLPMVAGSPS